MNEKFFLNGKPVDINFPIRPVFYGDGVFETFRCPGDLPLHLDRHIKRLKSGAELLSIPFPEETRLKEILLSAYRSSETEDAYTKLCLLPEGDSTFYKRPESSSVLITIKPCNAVSGPVSVCVSSVKRNQNSVLNTVKSMNYLESILVKREAVDKGFHDAVILNQNGEITETSSYNIFWTRGKTVFTPSVQCGLLPGITREIVIDVVNELGYQINERRFGLSYMLNADFVFLTNSISGIVFVNMINDLRIPVIDEKVSPIIELFNEKMGW